MESSDEELERCASDREDEALMLLILWLLIKVVAAAFAIRSSIW
ncbi:hypothetical protein GN244_ATG11219 [Phytophthora infestans]|uniref:Uncharacterized protein n=1 Tax=Phytophthora infestans TaxID=4787 RepID=A0A833WBK4_PHYIN|nr:hypothetical protein GN244_ATG11219 [Phytophthora infestans]